MTIAGVPSLRLFLALWPDDATRRSLARQQQEWGWPPGAALVPPEKLHVTLHFLGAVPATRLPALRPLLAVAGQSFELGAEGARTKVWPGGIAVLELAAPPALQELHAALATALRNQGFASELRAYRPHVTFARKATGARPPGAVRPFAWRCDGTWALVRSSPREGYQVVAVDALR
ncbi:MULTISPECIES: RNA 2',3'-cyclic phosphodiesterase [Ramlibacter]|uniref:RNA 2',3'-cyclic phosphodiesterase n=1 Tax=Ramlibacter TaxID=174951 RepID=UPI003083FFE3